MTRTCIRTRALLFALPALAAFAAAPQPAGATTQVAFSATLTGKAAIAGVGAFTFVGGGPSAPFGPITNNGTARVTGLSLSCLAGLANDNVETFTVAGGDTLVIKSIDVGCPTGVGSFHGTGTWTVTGGTGRFAHATGSGSLEGHADFVAGTYTMNASGTITSP